MINIKKIAVFFIVNHQIRGNMSLQNTLYIAEPIFSEKLQKFDPESSFPPIKKIGITTDHPGRREKELLGTMSPVKVSIVKAWTGINARDIESMLHNILDNTRLDSEDSSRRARISMTKLETIISSIKKFRRKTLNQVNSDDAKSRAAD